MSVLTIASNKGGVGKTVTSTTIAASLAARDKTTLVDLDAQGHAALCLGFDPRSGVLDWLVGNQPLSNCILHTADNLMLIPGNSRTKLVENHFREQSGGFDLLIERLRSLPAKWTVLDTAPGGYLQEAALAAADHVIVPFEPETLGMDGVDATMSLVERLAASATVTLLPVAYDRRIAEHQQCLAEITEDFGDMVASYIPVRSAVKQAVAAGVSIWHYSHPRLGDVRAAYAKLVDRIRALEERREEGRDDG